MFYFQNIQAEQIIHWSDKEPTGAIGWIVIDKKINKVAGGGLFMHKDASLKEVQDLARSMTYKNSLQEIPFGGGKGGIKFDHNDIRAKEVLERFLQDHKNILEDVWCTGADLNTTNDQINHIVKMKLGMASPFISLAKMLKKVNNVTFNTKVFEGCLTFPAQGIFTLETSITGYILAQTIKLLTNKENSLSPRIVIQGFGTVGKSLAYFIQQEKIGTIVGICDKDSYIINNKGINIDIHLAAEKDNTHVFNVNAEERIIKKSANIKNNNEFLKEFLLNVKADVFSPCANRYSINEEILGVLIKNCFTASNRKYIISGANNVFSTIELVEKAINNDIIFLPEWVSNCGNALLFQDSLKQSHIPDNWEHIIQNNIKSRVYNFINNAHDIASRKNKSLYYACHEVALEIIKQTSNN